MLLSQLVARIVQGGLGPRVVWAGFKAPQIVLMEPSTIISEFRDSVNKVTEAFISVEHEFDSLVHELPEVTTFCDHSYRI